MTHPCQRVYRLADTVDEFERDCKSKQTSRGFLSLLVRGEVAGARRFIVYERAPRAKPGSFAARIRGAVNDKIGIEPPD